MKHGKYVILCVDDDPSFGDLYRAMLEPRGYEVHWAKNPGEGFDGCMALRPDLVLLDVMMPEKDGFFDGYDLLKRLRGEGPCMATPIIMISAIGGDDDVQHGLDLGATAYIPKQELVPSRLLKEITKLLPALEK